MRLEYVVVGLVLMLIIFVVVLTMLSSVSPGIDNIFKLFK